MMISVKILLVLSVFLTAFFGINGDDDVVEVGDIAVYGTPNPRKVTCVKCNADKSNIQMPGSIRVDIMKTNHPQYERFKDLAGENGIYSPEVSREIYKVTTIELLLSSINRFYPKNINNSDTVSSKGGSSKS